MKYAFLLLALLLPPGSQSAGGPPRVVLVRQDGERTEFSENGRVATPAALLHEPRGGVDGALGVGQ